MTRAQDPGGFSFELSESAPPVASEEGTPVGELDLDLDDFGPGIELSSHAPAVQECSRSGDHQDENPAPLSFDDPWTSSTLSPAASNPTQKPESAASSEEPTFHFSSASSTTMPLKAPEPAETTEPAKKTTLQKSAAHPREVAAAASAPQIKKIQFPARPRKQAAVPNAATKAEKAPPQEQAPAPPRSNPTTRFSSSVSQRAPEVDRDSDAELYGTSSLAPPEDLDDFKSNPGESSGNDRPASQGWDSETPSAREIWHNARRVWQTTSKHAVTWGGQGLKSAQKLARNVNHRLQARLEDAAEERKRKWEDQQALIGGDVSLGAEQVPPPARPTLDSEPQATAHTQRPPAPPKRPSAVSLALLGVAKKTARKTAAPLSALAAAAAVYLGGTHLLGIEGGIELSKVSTPGPKIPDLGALPVSKSSQSGAEPPPAQAQPGKDAPAKKAVMEMQTEQGPMPEGLSWPGKGLIEVVTSEDELIYIDGVFTGRGPLRRIPVTPGKHHVAIKTGGKERTGTVEVIADKNTRAVFKNPKVPDTAQEKTAD